MGCESCGTKTSVGLPMGCKNNGTCQTGGCGSKMDVYDWLSNIYVSEKAYNHPPVVEVKFKGTRKEYYKNSSNLELETGDAVVVESSTGGWDLGYISLSGDLVKLQMRKYKIDENSPMMKKVMRRALDNDMARYEEGKNLEQETMIKARQIAYGVGLQMKISDVEYQGDRTKATFFYTAEGRVDFRELIKNLAHSFRIKVEMRQIGLRQEAGRLGGIGSCGRELCCSTWLTDFHSVPTTAARYQNLFLNPLKLSGQCGRLKCCLNYELDTYVEAIREFPDENIVLKTAKGDCRIEKTDILKRIVWLKYFDDPAGKLFPLELSKFKQLIELNRDGILPTELEEHLSEAEAPVKEVEFKDTVGEERLDRFDQKRKKKKNNNNNRNRRDQGHSQMQGNQSNPNQGPRNQNPNQGQRNQNPNQGPRNQNPNQGQKNQNPNQGPRNPNQNQGPRNPNPNQGPRNPNPDQGPRNDNRNNPPRNNRGNNRPNNQGGNPEKPDA